MSFRATLKRRNGRCLFFLRYLFCNHFASASVNAVSPRMLLRTVNFVEPIVQERNRAVIFNRDSQAPDPLNHVPELFSPRNSSRFTVVVRTVYSPYQSQSSHIYVLPFSRIVERHRIGMPGLKPANRSCANAGKDRPVLVRRSQQLVHT